MPQDAPTFDPASEAIAHFGLRVTSITPVPESYSSTVRLLTLASGERLVLKIPYVRQKLLRELNALQAFANDLPVPRVLDAWIADDGPGAMLLAHLPGTIIEGLVQPQLAYQMGELLARLHRHTLDHYGETYLPPDDDSLGWWEFMRDRWELWTRDASTVLPSDLVAAADALHDRLYANLPEPDGPRWLHCDYRPGNILVEDGVITGLIDFESARGGSADLDFVKISHRVWDAVPGTRAAFLNGYASVRPVPEIDHSLTYYQLHNAMGGVAWCVRRSDTEDPFLRENLEVLQHLMADADASPNRRSDR